MPDEPIPPQMPFDPSKQMRELSARVAFVEERYKTFENRLKQLQKNVIEHHQDLRRMMRELDRQILTLSNSMEQMTDSMKVLRNEILLRASKEDVAVLKKYIDLWNPFQFVTQDQVEEIVHEVMKEGH